MPAASNLDWLYHLLGWTLAVAGLLLFLRSLLWDPSRGRPRCPKCWYSMEGSDSLKCPECGHEARSRRELFKTRRRRDGMVLAVLLMIVAYPAYWSKRIATQGWVGALPTTPLIWWVSRYEPPEAYRNNLWNKPTPYAKELARRARGRELADWQWPWMLRTVGVVRAREKWPVGEPYYISTGVPRWLQAAIPSIPFEGPHAAFSIKTPLEGADRPMHDHLFAWKAGRLAEGNRALTLQVVAGPWSGPWRIQVQQVARPEDAIITEASPALDAAVRRAMDIGIRRDRRTTGSTTTDFTLGVRLYRDRGPVPDDLAIAVKVELIQDGQIRAQWTLLPYDSAYGEPVDWQRVNLADSYSSPDGWTVRVRGSPIDALRDVKRPRCWAGEYTIPLAEFIK